MPGSGSTAATQRKLRHGVASMAVFFAASLALLVWLKADFRPDPLYAYQSLHPVLPVMPIGAHKPLEMEFDLAGPQLDRLLMPVVVPEGGAELRVFATDAVTGQPVGRRRFIRSGVSVLKLGESTLGVERLRLRFESEATELKLAPALHWAKSRPAHRAEVFLQGASIADIEAVPNTGPMLVLEYEWPTRGLLWAWLLVVPLVVRAWNDPRAGPLLLVATALCATATSVLLWDGDCLRNAEHVDADDYGRTAEVLADYFTGDVSTDFTREWFHQYTHSTTALAPALMSVPIAMGAPADLVYLELSALSSFACLLIFAHILQVRMRVSYRATLVFSVIFASHLLMLRAFARPVTDAFGLLLVVATIDLLLKRMDSWQPRDDFALVVLAFCHPLARPQGWSYWLCMALAVIACDYARRGRWTGLREASTTLLRIFALPLVALGALHGLFGWLHNLQAMFDKAAHFRADNTAWFFYHSLAGTFQLLPLFWLRLGDRWRDPKLALCAVWLVLYLAVLIAVRAPFWLRHFLPILPAILLLAAAGFDRLRGGWRVGALGVLALTAAFNLSSTAHQIFYSTKPGVQFSRYISTP